MYYTEKQIESLDREAVENGLEIRQMMELAGLQMLNLFGVLKIPHSALVVVLCGKGNNGGDGLAAARFLVNEGWEVNVILAEAALNENASHHLKLLKKMKVPALVFSENPAKAEEWIQRAAILVDALLGYHIKGNPKKPYDRMIKLVNEVNAKVIAYDLPSGLEATNGHCSTPCVQADYTLTLAIPKKAYKTPSGKIQSGQTYVADIGIPEFLYDKILKKSRPDFKGKLIKL
jgi:hydroxyethylthiazole kinase-like uncharacterized protein yjeF